MTRVEELHTNKREATGWRCGLCRNLEWSTPQGL